MESLRIPIRARVCAVHRASVYLHAPDLPLTSHPLAASLDEALRRTTDPLAKITVGDWVQAVALDEGSWRVTGIERRRSVLARRAAGSDHAPQLLAANVDTALLFSPFPEAPNVRRLARLVSLCIAGDVQPVVVLSRADTASPMALAQGFDAIASFMPDVPVVTTSTRGDAGMRELDRWLTPGNTLVLLGPSGAGKSSLVNRLVGEEYMSTNNLRRDGAGRHTTTHRELLALPSGVAIIDTPGLREVGVWVAAGSGAPSVGDAIFPDIAAHATACRFRDCAHAQEPGCAVRRALQDGTLDIGRVTQWQQLQREQAHAERSDQERRQREREGSLLIRRLPKKGG